MKILSSLEIKYIVEELQSLLDSKVDNGAIIITYRVHNNEQEGDL